MGSEALSVFWFRRDLRLDDNHGLFRALKSGRPVLPIFIFDREILAALPRKDARVEFIHLRLAELDRDLRAAGSALHVFVGSPVSVWRDIFAKYSIHSVYCNEDYEPYALRRDEAVAELAAGHGANFYALKDQVVFAKNDVIKDDGQPYKVFTPYAKRWMARLKEEGLESYSSQRNLDALTKADDNRLPSLHDLGFEAAGLEFPPLKIDRAKIKSYARTRDILGDEEGTTRLGLHLRFGTLSVRKLVKVAEELSPVYLKELIWREFFQQILFHFPHTESEPFDPRYAKIAWIGTDEQFLAWKEGRTGYPIVDAAMHQLNATGFMHNRARMIVASFLTKHLLIDWRKGERYFAEKLLDFDLASNVGNWQWAAGCGCDAAPYFRVFNPTLQAKRFDAQGRYVSKWDGASGLKPIVDHEVARKRALSAYKKALG